MRQDKIVRLDPASPREEGQDLEEITRKPVVDKHGSKGISKVTKTRRSTPVCLILVEGGKQGDVGQIARPDHTGGIDKEGTEETSHTVTNELSSPNQQDASTPAEVLVIEKTLNSNNIHSISGTVRTISHDSDQDVFLHVEWTGIEEF